MALFKNLSCNLPLLSALALLAYVAYLAISRLYFHPLAKFPGPKLAAITTFWQAWKECVGSRSFHLVLEDLHSQYGDVIRIGPDELHFSNPQAYHDIYNNQNRWDKEVNLYHSFGEDRSSFGFLTYKEAKERKDALNKMFSAKAITQSTGLVIDKVNALCDSFAALAKTGKTADLTYAYRCMTMDIITYLCFGKSAGALKEPNYRAPILVAMDASLPVFKRFKHAKWYKNMIMGCPPNISRIVSPPTAGLVDLQQMLLKQIAELTEHPEQLDHLPHNMTIYHQLLDKESYRKGTVPVAGSLYDEAQALMFAGADTTGSALMLTSYYLLKQPDTHKKLTDEIREAWPNLQQVPTLRDFEQLPYLNAVIKEGLRMSSGVVSGLLRIVPKGGAKIAGHFVPEDSIVSCTSVMVHYNAEIFPSPHEFKPERWIEDPRLDNWLVAFSRGPRSCLGINLAWAELRLCLPYIFRRFNMKLNPASPKQLVFIDSFLPCFLGEHVKADLTIVSS